jgi:YVTN family beta-propeller protein
MLATSRRLQRFFPSTPALRTCVLLAITMPLAWLAEAAAAPKAYVGLFKDNAIAVLDTGTNRVQGTIPVPQGPHGIVITPDGRKVYVSSDGASAVSVIDTQTDKVVRSIEVGANPHGLAISPDGRQVLVGCLWDESGGAHRHQYRSDCAALACAHAPQQRAEP